MGAPQVIIHLEMIINGIFHESNQLLGIPYDLETLHMSSQTDADCRLRQIARGPKTPQADGLIRLRCWWLLSNHMSLINPVWDLNYNPKVVDKSCSLINPIV